MHEEVWTTYKIGGEIKSSAALTMMLDLLAAFTNGERPQRSELIDAVVANKPCIFAGLVNNDTHRALQAFLQEQGMPFFANRSGCRSFGAGIRFWKPGMGAPADHLADDDGNPLIELSTLHAAQQEGRALADVISYLEAATEVAPLSAAAAEVFDDAARRSIAERMGYPNALKVVEIQRGRERIEIALVPARRGYSVAVHTNCDPDNPTAGWSVREDFKDVILAAAAFDKAVQEAKGEMVTEENASL